MKMWKVSADIFLFIQFLEYFEQHDFTVVTKQEATELGSLTFLILPSYTTPKCV